MIETKIRNVTTHDVITYSKKAANHKAVHPYLRYGIFIGKMEHIPGRLIRHGKNFDFMLSWPSFKPSAQEENSLMKLIKKEVEASINLDEIMERRSVDKKYQQYTLLHRPLVLEP